MSDQPAEGTFTDADRSTVTSSTASNVQYHIFLLLTNTPLKHRIVSVLVQILLIYSIKSIHKKNHTNFSHHLFV